MAKASACDVRQRPMQWFSWVFTAGSTQYLAAIHLVSSVAFAWEIAPASLTETAARLGFAHWPSRRQIALCDGCNFGADGKLIKPGITGLLLAPNRSGLKAEDDAGAGAQAVLCIGSGVE
jgi:hypothetical protein